MQEDIVISNVSSQRLFDHLQSWIKRPSLNVSVSNILNEYESKLEESQIYLSNGIIITNFAEVGLILQGCAEVYGKQVDILHKKFIDLNLALIKLTSTNDNKQKASASESEPNENANKTKVERRRNKFKKNETESAIIVSSDSTKVQTEKFWKFPVQSNDTDYLPKLKLPDWELGGLKMYTYDKEYYTYDKEYYTYDKEYYTCSTLYKTTLNEQDLYLYHNVCSNGISWNTLHRMEKLSNGYIIEDLTENAECEPQKQREIDDQRGTPVILKELQVVLEQLSDVTIKKYTNNDLKQNVRKELRVCLERLTDEILKKKPLSKFSAIQRNLFHLPYKVLKEKSIFKLPKDFLMRAVNLKCSKKELRVILNKTKRSSQDREEDVIPLKKCKSYDLEYFENFCHDTFAAEGLLPPRIPKPVESDRVTSNNEDHQTECAINNSQQSSNLDRTYRTESGYETDPQRSPTPDPYDPFSFISSIITNPESLELYKSYLNPASSTETDDVFDWQRFISERVNTEEEEFDIHEYGTTVLNSFTKENGDIPEQKISFESVVKDKPFSEVARFFVATLQLANTNNIEISESKPGSLDSDNIQMKFLSASRYHEDFDSFHSPSEDLFRERLAALQKESLTSTPKSTLTSKKRSTVNIVNVSHKKRRLT